MANNTTSTSSRANPAVAGVTGAYDGHSLTLEFLIAFFAGLSIYNARELVFITFQRYHGLYFWSLLISSLGPIPYAIGFAFKFFDVLEGKARFVSVALLTLGWYAVITGQGVVLWSRLHLIVSGDKGHKILKYTKWMIIVDAIILHTPTTVVKFGSNGEIDTLGFVQAYNVVEKIQMTSFLGVSKGLILGKLLIVICSLQEVILSTIYIIETIKILRTSLRPRTRRLMHQLVFINVPIIIMDTALLSIEYGNLFVIEIFAKGVCYSIKLKLEFAILSRLVNFVGASQGDNGSANQGWSLTFPNQENTVSGKHDGNENGISEYVDITKTHSDYQHALPTPRKDRDIGRFQHFESIGIEIGD